MVTIIFFFAILAAEFAIAFLQDCNIHHECFPSDQPEGCPNLFQTNWSNLRFSACRYRLARPAGFEPATHGLEGRCSIQLSYGRLANLR